MLIFSVVNNKIAQNILFKQKIFIQHKKSCFEFKKKISSLSSFILCKFDFH